MSTTITWGGNPSTDVAGFVCEKPLRHALGAVLDQEVPMPGRDGSWVFPDARGNRRITAQFSINATIPARRTGVRSLGAWLDLAGYQELIFSDEPDRYWRAYLVAAPQVDEWRRRGRGVLEWSAEPYAYSTTLSEQIVTATGGSDSGVFSVPDSIGAHPVIEITPTNGTITSYTLTVNGYTLNVTSNIASGQTQTVSSVSYTISGGSYAEAELNGSYVPTPQWSVDASGSFPLLVSGNNAWSLSWTGTATSVDIGFNWRERSH